MKYISLLSAVPLTGKSERTLWRWIAEGLLKRGPEEIGTGKTTVSLESLIKHVCVPIADEDWLLLVEADAGNADAQNDLALLFLAEKSLSGAIYWLDLAAKQGHADAMHWLARCFIDGNGVQKDENLGLMWLAKSAANGHSISIGQMDEIRNRFVSK